MLELARRYKRFDIAKEEIRMPKGAIRQVGEEEIIVHLHPDVEAAITVNAVPA